MHKDTSVIISRMENLVTDRTAYILEAPLSILFTSSVTIPTAHRYRCRPIEHDGDPKKTRSTSVV